MNYLPRLPRLISGRQAIIVVGVLALCSAGYSWFYLRGLQKRPLEFWTSQRASAFLHASRIEALRLESATADDAGEQLSLPGGLYRVAETLDVTGARGLIHIRHALVHDGTYSDFGVPPIEPVKWAFALRFFVDGGESTAVIVAFDGESHQAAAPGGSTVARLKPTRPKVPGEMPRDPFAEFLTEQFRSN